VNAHELVKPVAAGAVVVAIMYYLSAQFVTYIEVR
jgi:hypothetical protein